MDKEIELAKSRKESKMRSDRKRKEKQKQKNNGLYRTIAIIYSILAVAFMVMLLWLNVLPAKILYPVVGLLFLITMFIVPVMYSKRGKRRKKGATVFALILIVLFGIGTYYINETLGFFNNITDVAKAKEDFYVVVKADSKYEEVSQLAGKTIATSSTTDKAYAEARNKLKKEINAQYEYIDNSSDMIQDLIQNKYSAAFISAASYETMKEGNSSIATETRVIHTISVTKESRRTTKHVDVTEESFNVLVSGLDTTGDIGTVSRSDVNMLITVNPVSHEVLLTSIPRDYYVPLASKNSGDKLTHSGLYGIDETVSTVEKFMGIDINYYVKVNYSTITKLVDAIGGIDIDSPYGFTTHGMSSHYTFVKGYNHLNGSMALAYSRERQSWPDGDFRRNENQQLIIQAIIKKATGSTTVLTNYTDILESIEDNLSTDMSSRNIKSLIKMQLKEMPKWTITKQAIKGDIALKHCYALGTNASVVLPDDAMIAEAVDKIMQVKGSDE